MTKRPPGAVAAEDFLVKCTRCGICLGICPANAITEDESGYPEFIGPCFACCKECMINCPTHALRPISKTEMRIGTAVIDEGRCNAWNPDIGGCLVCWEFCPVGAVTLTAKAVHDNPDSDPRDFISNPRVNAELCTGCAVCVHACPIKPPSIDVH